MTESLQLCRTAVLGLVLARCGAELWLDHLNRHYVRARAGSVPEAFKAVVDPATYARSIQYTLDRSRFSGVETVFDTLVLIAALFSGVLPGLFAAFERELGTAPWAAALFLFCVGLVLTLISLPFQWYAQFRLEARFGFNNTTPATWWLDRLKGTLLALVLGYPLLVMVLTLVQRLGAAWWAWAWALVLGFQLLMVVLAPVLIMPLFNKFTPLPNGPLRDRLLALAARTRFTAGSIQIMDGSRRSSHSNAFFTGFGRLRKIVLFDTLIQHLTEAELEAVLAHEIGHYKHRHIPKMLGWSAANMLLGFYAISWLAAREWFAPAFGFHSAGIVPALLLFGILGGVVMFWFSPLSNRWSRRWEYQADAYAAGAIGGHTALVGALRKLSEKNLSNLTPHPLYSAFYYSHPTLLEREQALAPSR